MLPDSCVWGELCNRDLSVFSVAEQFVVMFDMTHVSDIKSLGFY
jgi:hypothetical protein